MWNSETVDLTEKRPVKKFRTFLKKFLKLKLHYNVKICLSETVTRTARGKPQNSSNIICYVAQRHSS